MGAALIDILVHAPDLLPPTARNGRSGRSGLCGSTGGSSGSGGVCTGSPGRVGSVGVGGGGPGGTYFISLPAGLVTREESWKMFIDYLASSVPWWKGTRRQGRLAPDGAALKGDRMPPPKSVLRDD
jgi:hypothetical protein